MGLAAACVSCEKISARNNPYTPMILSTKASGFVQEGNAFALNLIDKINDASDEDYIMSPLSMQFLLGMLLDGAEDETAAEICNVLGYGAGEVAEVNDYCLSMLSQLPEMDKLTKLNIANAIFLNEICPLKEDYKNTVEKYYDAKVSNLDFSDVPGSTKKINKWCSDQTNGMIPKILDAVDPGMLAYLLNAMYFKGQWKEKFSKSATAEETFTDETGVSSQKKMMKLDKRFSYTENDVFQAVRLPYGNGAFSMTVLLPLAGHKVAEITGELRNAGGWKEFVRSMDGYDVDLWLPKFETGFSIVLNDILSEMGMPRAFNPLMAQFRAMSPNALCLGFVKQDAAIKVDEDGTEAAVVSMAGMVGDAAPEPGSHVVFHADHPFMYIISESSSGAILFAGRFGGK